MLTKNALHILKQAELRRLPQTIDDRTEGVDLAEFRELHRAGYMEAIDASAEDGDSYLEPNLTLLGRQALHKATASAIPWWANFDRRVAVVGLVVTVLGLAATLGVLKGQ